jgi:hypothetical protein
MESSSSIKIRKNPATLLDKYNCNKFYFEALDCAKKISDNPKLCDEQIKRIGECVYKGMLKEEKKEFIK